MTHVTCWLPLLLVVYIVWQAYHSSNLKDEILFLKRQKPRCENNLRGEISYFRKENEHLTYRINEVVADRSRLMYQLQEFKTKLQQSDSVSSDLKRELQEREEFLKSNKDKQEQLQTTIDELTKTVEALKQRLQVLCEPPKFACRSLLIAAKSGDLNNTKRLVTCSGDITKDNCESTDGFRFTPLIFAARNGHVELVQMLLEAGTNLERSSASGWTALHQAAKLERLEVCRLLLDWGANVDSLNVGRDTPLHLAARHGHLSVVKLPVERGADVGLKNDDGQTALHDSAGRGHLSVVKLFVERGADVRLKNVFGQTASDLAQSAGRKDVAEWLDSASRRVRRDVHTAECNSTATDCLTTSVRSQNQSAILESGQQQGMQTAACDPTEKLEPVSREADKDCGPQDGVCSSLHTILLSGDVNALETVIRCSKDNCIDGDGFGYPPLVSAARSGRVEMVRVMLEACANVDRSDIFGFTALNVAAKYGHLEVCRLLLDWGANVNARDRTQNTPLHWAAWRGHLLVVKLLVEEGADIRLKNDKNLTASEFAWKEEKRDVAEWLDSVRRG